MVDTAPRAGTAALPFSTVPAATGLYDPAAREGRLRARDGRDAPRHARATTSSTTRSTRCGTSSTAVPSAPTRAPATAPASSRRSRDEFLRAVAPFALPEAGEYAVGLGFLPDRRRASATR